MLDITITDVAEAFMRLCEALGIAATPLAYLDVPAVLRAAEMRGVERSAMVVEGGSFLHSESPAAKFAVECSAAIRRELT